jgi:hypothetical protein
MQLSLRGAAKIFLSVNIVLLLASAFTIMAILLENTPNGYEWYYNITDNIQPFAIGTWFLTLALSPILATLLSLRFGYELGKTFHWRISIVILLFIGIPSLLFVVLVYFMSGI